MEKRYVLHAGFVRAKDGDMHFISCERLAKLYGVKMSDCYCNWFNLEDVTMPWWRGLNIVQLREIVHLYPREDGDYDLDAVIS